MKCFNNLFTPSKSERNISFGDKVYVRISHHNYNPDIIADFTLDDIDDLCDVYKELRNHTSEFHGMVNLYVRNISRGWSMQQPFKLYGQNRRPA